MAGASRATIAAPFLLWGEVELIPEITFTRQPGYVLHRRRGDTRSVLKTLVANIW
jgi:hypothetical protein